ncbi:hypothetical protein JOQ06_007516 [Pogonophryne albipinna]|uniref:Uncharacterized protein n=1 Tax=Pogonophryne albipinna TaxID=1090488 RepID=A0AAD6FIA6_9TELE|nr:hypothetical protein JOQ06_007516 [Pogonophryne albipinna]
MVKFFPISLEILEEIFLNLPPGEVVRVCRQRRNILKNPRGEEELSGWLILNNDYRCFRYSGRFGGLDGFGGNRWAVHGIREPHPDETVQKNVVTSYTMAKKSQLIDLEKEGYSPSFMDHFQPDIRISDWYAPRCDCGCIYEIRVELLNEKKRPIQTFAPEIVEFKYGSDERWNEEFDLPLLILEEIFLNLPPNQVVRACRLVSHQWKEVVDSESLWKERCRREGFHLRDTYKKPKDWKLFYFLCKQRRNLLKNPRGEHKMRNWKILENGGDRWKVEGLLVPHQNEKVQKNFVTSYGMCRKEQLIDLEKEGYNASFMDHFQPDIKISDWYAPRWDCGSQYEICVELLNHSKGIVQTFAPDTITFEQWNDQNWNQLTHVFQNYGPGVRYIRFTHGGRDTQFWAGWFGIRVTDSSVEICPAADT